MPTTIRTRKKRVFQREIGEPGSLRKTSKRVRSDGHDRSCSSWSYSGEIYEDAKGGQTDDRTKQISQISVACGTAADLRSRFLYRFFWDTSVITCRCVAQFEAQESRHRFCAHHNAISLETAWPPWWRSSGFHGPLSRRSDVRRTAPSPVLTISK